MLMAKKSRVHMICEMYKFELQMHCPPITSSHISPQYTLLHCKCTIHLCKFVYLNSPVVHRINLGEPLEEDAALGISRICPPLPFKLEDDQNVTSLTKCMLLQL
jgi:hypothetical protein